MEGLGEKKCFGVFAIYSSLRLSTSVLGLVGGAWEESMTQISVIYGKNFFRTSNNDLQLSVISSTFAEKMKFN